MKNILPILVLLLAGLVGGCGQASFLVYLFSPENPTTTVEAEYKDLSDATVAVVIYTSQSTQVDHPLVRLALASVMGTEMKQRLHQVSVIDPRTVVKFQDETPNWETLPRSQVARTLGADYLLYVVLSEYSTMEPSSLNLYRGQATADVSLFKAALDEPQCRVWGRETFHVSYPQNTAVGVTASNDEEIAYQTQRLLADLVVKKFYKHKVPEKS